MKAVGYIRCSTEDQHLGPIAQRAALAQWCDVNGYELVAVFEEHISGGAPLDKREQLLAAVDALQPGGILVVAKRDRLARDTMTAALVERLVERAKGEIVSVDGTGNGEGPEAQLMRRMIDAFAEYERAIIRARTRAALNVKARRGERVGGIPYGQRLAADGLHLELEPAEQAVIARVRQLRAEGLSLRMIVETLNTAGAPARGARWHQTSVRRLLARAA